MLRVDLIPPQWANTDKQSYEIERKPLMVENIENISNPAKYKKDYSGQKQVLISYKQLLIGPTQTMDGDSFMRRRRSIDYYDSYTPTDDFNLLTSSTQNIDGDTYTRRRRSGDYSKNYEGTYSPRF